MIISIPSRIIVGAPQEDDSLKEAAKTFASLLAAGAIKENIDILFTETTEAEALNFLLTRILHFVSVSLMN